MGNEYLYEVLVQKNMDNFNNFKIKNILTTCPHCYNQLKNEYIKFGGAFNVKHHAEFILNLIKENKIKLTDVKNNIKTSIHTFHDPCYMGRYNRDYSSSRNILNKLSILSKEMILNKEKSFCCGAGGGRMFMEEDASNRVNRERIKQAKDIQAQTIVTACPFCKTMLSDGLTDESIKIKDIVDLVSENIK
jgi:Fe-S oxidoreductase